MNWIDIIKRTLRWLNEGMDFIFEWCFYQSKIKSIPSRHRVISSIYTYQFKWQSFLIPAWFLSEVNQHVCCNHTVKYFYKYEMKTLCIDKYAYLLHTVAHIHTYIGKITWLTFSHVIFGYTVNLWFQFEFINLPQELQIK